MSTVTLNAENIGQSLEAEGITLIDWWADWCGPCKQFAPIYEAASEQHTDITFAKIDTEVDPNLTMEFGVRAMPTLMAIRDGVLVYNEAGALPGPALEQIIQAVRDLDMDEVKAKVAEQQAQQA